MTNSGQAILRVLVVEDHAPTRRGLQEFLRKRGHVALVADGLERGVAMLAAGEFDLVMSDLALTDGSGLDLLPRVAPKTVPYAVAVSGYGSRADRARSEKAGFHGHFVKPLTYAQLDQILESASAAANQTRSKSEGVL